MTDVKRYLDDSAKFKPKLGIVQSRLIPGIGSQEFSIKHWQDEFIIAQRMNETPGADYECRHIEWMLNEESLNFLESIKATDLQFLCERTGIICDTVCLDNFLKQGVVNPFVDKDVIASLKRFSLWLYRNNGGPFKRFVVPLLENASVRLPSRMMAFRKMFVTFMRDAGITWKDVSIESDLTPMEFTKTFEGIEGVKMTLDTGNLMRLGLDPLVYATTFWNIIDNVHLKLATFGRGSIPLSDYTSEHRTFFHKLMPLLAKDKCPLLDERLTFQFAKMSDPIVDHYGNCRLIHSFFDKKTWSSI